MPDSDDLAREVRKQDAVYWERTGFDSFGKPQYAAPVDVKVRWSDVREEYLNAEGNRAISRSKLLIPDDVEGGDVFMLGTVAGSVIPGKLPLQHTGAYTVQLFEKIPDEAGTKFLRKAMI